MIINWNQKFLSEIIAEGIGIVSGESAQYIYDEAYKIRLANFGNSVYVRGLIEFTNYCKNDCYYCGIRCSNAQTDRYRLTMDEILESCSIGHTLGIKTFVLQGGEDYSYSQEQICDLIYSIKSKYPESAVTLSIGERSREDYQAWFDAGADRYLLRHETANSAHYSMLHPSNLSFDKRRRCLYALKEIGYQTGAGFMVGTPGQTCNTLAEDLLFLKELQPHMVGIGPFIPHAQTPFGAMSAGTLNAVLFMLALTRILLPSSLLPSTTALETIADNGRELGFKAGANVVMPNLSPTAVREKYSLYDSKLRSESQKETAENLTLLQNRAEKAGFVFDFSRGDYISNTKSH